MAEKKIVLTLQRVYKKEIEIEVDSEQFEGLSNEEIVDKLCDGEGIDETEIDNSFADASFYEFDNVEGDRYYIYEDGKNIYGGHL